MVGLGRGQQHLDGARKQVRPADRADLLAQQPAHRGHRGLLATTGRPEQGETGLRLVPETSRPVVSLLGAREVAAGPQDVAALGHRQTRGGRDLGVGVAARREFELLDRLGERAPDAHDLAAVHRALAGEHDQAGLRVDPRGERAGPLRRAAVVADLLARLDQRAVHLARGHRRHVAGRDPDHRLVEQRQAFGDAARVEQQPALRVEAVGHQIGVAVPAPVLDDVERQPVGGVVVTGEEAPQHRVHEQVATLDDVPGNVVEQALTAAHPATGDRRFTTHQQDHGEPEPAAHGPGGVSRVHMSLVGPLHRLDAVVRPADQVGRGGELGEVVGGQHGVVRFGQGVVGRHPLAVLESRAGPRQIVDYAHLASPSVTG